MTKTKTRTRNHLLESQEEDRISYQETREFVEEYVRENERFGEIDYSYEWPTDDTD